MGRVQLVTCPTKYRQVPQRKKRQSVPYVMDQLGHSNPRVTLSIYTHVLERKRDHGKRLDALVRGTDWAPMGTSEDSMTEPVPDFQRPRQDSNLRPAA
jgi:hypothetical protein